jgi:hypothetical protein
MEDKLGNFMDSFSAGRDRAALKQDEEELFQLLGDPDACRPDIAPSMCLTEGFIPAKCLRELDGPAIQRIGACLRGALPRTFTSGVNQIKMQARALEMA